MRQANRQFSVIGPCRGAGVAGVLLCALLSAPLPVRVFAAEPAVTRGTPQDSAARGQQAMDRGHMERAIAEWEEALAATDPSAKDRRADLHGAIADACLWLGRDRQAIENLESARRLATEIKDPVRQARFARQLGAAYLAGGRITDAQTHLQEALSAAEKLGNAVMIAAAFNDLGNLAMQQRDWRAAAERYGRAADSAQKAGNASLASTAHANAAAALLEMGQRDPAREALRRAAKDSRTLPDSHDKAYLLLRTGWMMQRLAEGSDPKSGRPEAYAQFDEARRVADGLGDDRAGAYARGYLGALYELQGRNEEALRLTQQAIAMAQKAAAPESLYRWQWQAARLLEKQGNRQLALTHYSQSVDTLDRVRSQLAARSHEGASSFALDVAALYRAYVALLIDTGMAAGDPPARASQLWKVQETMERYKAAELEDYFQDDCVAAAREKVKRIDKALSPDTVVLYPIVLPERVVLLQTFASGIEAVAINVDERRLNSEIAAFRSKLEKRGTREYLQHARQLYQWLIQPIEPGLRSRGIRTIVVVPDGALHSIPVAALHDGQRFLIERFAVATTVGIELTDPRPIDRKSIKVLLSGISQAHAGFGALPFVNAELDGIQRRFGAKRLQNDGFVTTAFRNELERENYSIVHIASHGKFETDIADSFILAYDHRLDLGELERYMSVNRVRDRPVELLTLSACQTAVGSDRAALGLAGIAVKAGARSALATLWYINDQATANLVHDFYAALQDPALTKAQALQRAQRTMLQDLRYRHPGYWSPFLLIGNWL